MMADNKPQIAEDIEHEFKQGQMDLFEAMDALVAIGLKPKRAVKLVWKWDDEVEAEEPILYTFRIWFEEDYWMHGSDAQLLRPLFLDEFIYLNEKRLKELLKRASASWQPPRERAELRLPWLDFFWEEDENEARCIPGYFATDKFRERLPIPPGVPYRNEKTHKQYFGR